MIRTRDSLLGRQGLCQLSYARLLCKPVGAKGFEPSTSASQTPRAARLRHAPLSLVYQKRGFRQKKRLPLAPDICSAWAKQVRASTP